MEESFGMDDEVVTESLGQEEEVFGQDDEVLEDSSATPQESLVRRPISPGEEYSEEELDDYEAKSTEFLGEPGAKGSSSLELDQQPKDQLFATENEIGVPPIPETGYVPPKSVKYPYENPYKDMAANDRTQLIDEKTLDINTQMYEGMSQEAAWKKYEQIKKQAKEFSVFGNPIVDGRVVPDPFNYGTHNAGILAGMSSGDLIADATRNVVRSLAITAGALIEEGSDVVNDKLGGTTGYRFDVGDGLTELAQKNIAKSPRAVGGDAAVESALEYGIPALAGAKLGRGVGKAMGKPDFGPMSSALTALGGTIAAVSAMDPEASTLATGDNSFMKWFPGVPLDAGANAAQKVLNNKINQLYDAGLSVLPIRAGLVSGDLAWNFVAKTVVEPMMDMFSKTRQENKLVASVLSKLNVNDMKATKELVDFLENNKKAVIEFAEQKFGFDRTTMSAIAEGASKKAKELYGPDKEKYDLLSMTSSEAQKGVMKTDYTPNLAWRLQEPGRKLSELQSESVALEGGFDTIQNTGEKFAGKTIDAIKDIRTNALVASSEIDAFDMQIREGLKKDPVFGAQFDNFAREAGLLTGKKEVLKSEDSVVAVLVKGVKAMGKRKNELYAAIPGDALIDTKSFREVTEAAAADLPKDLYDSIVKAADTDTMDFKYINNTVLPRLNKHIHDIMTKKADVKSVQDIGPLLQMRDNIQNTQLDFLTTNGDKDVQEAAIAAKKYYVETYLDYAEDPRSPIGAIFDAYNATTNRGKDLLDTVGTLSDTSALTRVDTTARKSLEGLGDKKPAEFTQLTNFLKSPEAGEEGTKQLGQIYRGKIFSNLAERLQNTDDLTSINPSDFLAPLKGKEGIISKEFPEIELELNDIVNKLRTGKIGKEAALVRFKEVEAEGLRAEQAVYESALSKFVNKSNVGIPTQKGNMYQVFSDMFDDPQSAPLIDELLKSAAQSGDPLVKKGIKGAYVAHLEKLFKNTQTGDLDERQLAEFFDPRSSLWSYGEKIYSTPDEREFIRGYKEAVQLTLGEYQKLVPKGIVPMNPGTFSQEASGALGLIIKQTLGPLNKLGTKWQSGGSKVIKLLNPAERVEKITDNFFADPEYAIELLKRQQQALTSTFGPDTKEVLFQTGILLGVYNQDDLGEFMKLTNQELEEAFGRIDGSNVDNRGQSMKLPPGVLLENIKENPR